jgi:Reverse transcriptase (RNA-dependent DNA polymerase)
MKARLVAGGNFVDTSLIGDTRAPTARSISVLFTLAYAANQGFNIMTGDISTAFLIPNIDQNVEKDIQYVVIQPNLAKVFTQLFPETKPYVDPQGKLLARLLKWLYGLPQSAERFSTHLFNSMTKLGFRTFSGDRCMFIKDFGDQCLLVVAHVDDLLATGPQRPLEQFIADIQKIYKMTIQEGMKHSYLGLDIQQLVSEKHGKTVVVSQQGYQKELLKKYADLIHQHYPSDKIIDTPSTIKILTMNSPTATPCDTTKYASVVMSIMFLARYTRPDLLFTCSILSTHCSAPNTEHMHHAVRLLKYINDGPTYGIMYSKTPFKGILGADASHGCHPDGKGHAGHTVTLGTGLIYSRSYKLKIITLSSTESEQCAASDLVKIGKYLNELCQNVHIPIKPCALLQDNTSTMSLNEKDGNFARNAHLLIRHNYIKEAIIEGEIQTEYQNTEAMYTDLLTKPPENKTRLDKDMKAMGMVKLKSQDVGNSNSI